MTEIDYNELLKKLPPEPGFLSRPGLRRSVVLVPFLDLNSQLTLLFEKRAEAIRQGGEISFPGGAFDPDHDSDLSSTALRETCEELGVGPDKVLIEGQFHSLINSSRSWIDVFIGRLLIESPADLKINHEEVEKVLTVPFDFFLANEPEIYEMETESRSYTIDDQGIKKILFPARDLGIPPRYWDKWGTLRHGIFVYRYDDEVIWGLTARIVRGLVNSLFTDQ